MKVTDRKCIEASKASYDVSYGHYQQIYNAFMKFEDVAVEYYGNGEIGERLLTHPGAGEMKEKISETIKAYKNPFTECMLWIRGEMLDIQGMIDAMNGRQSVMKRQIATENKKRDDQEELEKLQKTVYYHV